MILSTHFEHPRIKKFFLIFFLLLICIRSQGNLFDSLPKDTIPTVFSSDSAKIDYLINKADNYKKTKTRYSISLLNYADSIANKLNLREPLAKIYYLKSIDYKIIGLPDSAKIFIQMAFDLYNTLSDSLGKANCLNIKGSILFRERNLFSALELHKQANVLFIKMHDTLGQIKVLNNIGLVYKELSQHDSATLYFMKLIRLSELNKNKEGVLVGWINLSQIFLDIDDFNNANFYINKSISFSKEQNDLSNLALEYNKLGTIFQKQNNFDSALMNYRISEKYYADLENTRGHGDVFLNIASCYFEMGNMKMAENNFKKSYQEYVNGNYKIGILKVFMNLALMAEKRNEFLKAISFYDSSLILSKQSESPNERMIIYYNVHFLLKKLGRNGESLDYLTKYISLKDSIFTIEKTKLIEDLELKYETEKKEAQILALNNENLKKDLKIHEETNRKNIFLAGGGLFFILTIFTYLYYKQRIRKNKQIAEQQLLKSEEEKKVSSAQALLEGQEQERIRVAKELHDSVGLLLSTSKLHISRGIGNKVKKDNGITRAEELIDQANNEVRRISRGLFPPVLQMSGLTDSIEDLLDEVDKLEGKYGSFFVKGESKRMSETRELMTYRIVQELVNNFLKHSNGDTIDIELIYENNTLTIQYLENGTGFDFEKMLAGKTVGLKSISSRIDFLKASFKFIVGESDTRINITIPILPDEEL